MLARSTKLTSRERHRVPRFGGVEEGFSCFTGLPLLTVVGEQTFPMMEESADAIAAAIPEARSETVAGAFHSWDPEAMAARLTEFTLAIQ